METKINFKSYDGTKLVGIYQTPESVPLKGIFLLIHGIPSEKDEWGFYKDMATEFETYGYASFRFDFRCNGESGGGDIINLTLSGLVNDIEAAYCKLISIVKVSLPIYVIGTSCGGGVAIKWINSFQRKINHLFLMAPVLDYNYEIFGTDLSSDADPSDIIPMNLQEQLNKNGYLDRDIHYGRAMINEAHLFDAEAEIRCLRSDIDITIMQGNADTVVPYSKSQHIAKIFHHKIQLITVPDADHGFAVEGDDDLTAYGTKENHRFVYSEILKKVMI